MPFESNENGVEVIEVEPSTIEPFASVDPFPDALLKPRALRMLLVEPGKLVPLALLSPSKLDTLPLLLVNNFCSFMCMLM